MARMVSAFYSPAMTDCLSRSRTEDASVAKTMALSQKRRSLILEMYMCMLPPEELQTPSTHASNLTHIFKLRMITSK